ncbi:MAG: PDZ domain-containing protein, partial [Planctomycetes bacterium]|nr:PDZ domain-containing protein [Planctomycetota bacterium]
MKALLAALFVFTLAGPDYDKLLKEAKLTLSEAIDKAQEEAKDGIPLQAELEKDGKKVVFSVAVAKGNKTLLLGLDAQEGKVSDKEDHKKNPSKLAKATKTSLKDAIAAALKKVEGKAVWAEITLKGKEAQAEVRVFKDGKLYSVTVGEDGKVASSGEYKAKSKEQGFLGIQMAQGGDDEEEEETEGVRIGQVIEDSAAEEAGLEEDDVIVAVNGEKTPGFEDLRDIIEEIGAGGKARIEILRGKKKM